MRIRALVSGYPGERGRKRQLLMLQSFIDASGKGSPQRLVLAGYIAPVEVWEPFSIAWKTRLDEAGLPYFKMTEQRSKPEIAGYFYRLVEDYDVRAAISCIVNTADLTKVCQSIKWPPGMVNIRAKGVVLVSHDKSVPAALCPNHDTTPGRPLRQVSLLPNAGHLLERRRHKST